MDFLVPVAIAVAVLAAILIYQRIAAARAASRWNARSVERQRAIQSAIDALGRTLKSSTATMQEGENAMRIARDALNQLDVQGDLAELIADNEQFFNEWRASRVSA